MTTPSSGAIINAAADSNILNRAVALATLMGVPNPEYALRSNPQRLAVTQVDASGTATIASVYEYAVAQMPPPPGMNPAAITDEHLRYAISQLVEQGVLQPPKTAVEE